MAFLPRRVALVNVEVLSHPSRYSPAQRELAFLVAYSLGRGRLVLAIAPEN